MRVVVVTGSRHMSNDKLMAAVLMQHNPHLVMHGAAAGADTLASIWCYHTGTTQLPFPAKWQEQGKKAGVVRNVHMLTVARMMADYGHSIYVCAFAAASSVGTFHCIKAARNLELPTFEYPLLEDDVCKR